MRGNILVITICECLFRVSIDIIWPFLSLYVLSLGGSYETIGLIMAAGNIASIILYPLGGYIADRQGRIKIISYMTFLMAATFLIPAFTNSWELLAVGMLIQSFFTFYFPVLGALKADSIPPDQRGIGFATVMAIPNAVGIASPLLGGWLIEIWGMNRAIKFLFLVGALVGMIIAYVRHRFLVETAENPDQLQITLKTVPGMVFESFRDAFRVFREVPRPLMVLSMLITSSIFFVSLTSGFWLVRATEELGLTTYQWGVVMLVSGSINVLLSIPAGGLVDRLSKKWIIGISMMAGSLPTLLFLKATTYHHILILAGAITLVNIFINPAFQAIFANMTPRAKRGRIMALMGSGGVRLLQGAWGSGIIGMIAQTSGTFLSGYLYRYDKSLPWMFLSASLVITGVLFILLIKEPKEAEH